MKFCFLQNILMKFSQNIGQMRINKIINHLKSNYYEKIILYDLYPISICRKV